MSGSGYGGLSESGLCVFRKLCQIYFLVVSYGSSVLLQSVVVFVCHDQVGCQIIQSSYR